MILSPTWWPQGEQVDLFDELARAGFVRLRIEQCT